MDIQKHIRQIQHTQHRYHVLYFVGQRNQFAQIYQTDLLGQAEPISCMINVEKMTYIEIALEQLRKLVVVAYYTMSSPRNWILFLHKVVALEQLCKMVWAHVNNINQLMLYIFSFLGQQMVYQLVITLYSRPMFIYNFLNRT